MTRVLFIFCCYLLSGCMQFAPPGEKKSGLKVLDEATYVGEMLFSNGSLVTFEALYQELDKGYLHEHIELVVPSPDPKDIAYLTGSFTNGVLLVANLCEPALPMPRCMAVEEVEELELRQQGVSILNQVYTQVSINMRKQYWEERHPEPIPIEIPAIGVTYA